MSEPDKNTLAKFSIADSAIAMMAEQYMPLTIDGISDDAGFKAVHEARMIVRGKRVDVEKTRKELKADALEYGRRVDTEAKRLTGLLEPIEHHLQSEEDRINKEKDAIKNAAKLKAEAEARAKREAEEAALRAEQERLAEERRKIEAEREEIEAEKRRIADEEATRQRAIELEKARAEAAERARAETEARIKREADERELRERRDAEEAARLEVMRPDREKLLNLADKIEDLRILALPNTPSRIREMVCSVCTRAANEIREIANSKMAETVVSEGNW